MNKNNLNIHTNCSSVEGPATTVNFAYTPDQLMEELDVSQVYVLGLMNQQEINGSHTFAIADLTRNPNSSNTLNVLAPTPDPLNQCVNNNIIPQHNTSVRAAELRRLIEPLSHQHVVLNVALPNELQENSHVQSFLIGFLAGSDSKINVCFNFLGLEVTQEMLDFASVLANANIYARTLTAVPPSTLTTPNMIGRIQELAEQNNLTMTVYNREQLQELSMGGILGVGAAYTENRDVAMVQLRYIGAPENVNELGRTLWNGALVGKGLLFDTGGANLKYSRGSMEMMTLDMGGAAVTLATIQAIAQLGLNINVIASIGLAWNLQGPEMTTPGQTLRLCNGMQFRAEHTDAEGRIVVGDVIAHLSLTEQINGPIIATSTLTGSNSYSGRMHFVTNDQELGSHFEDVGAEVGEQFMNLPNFARYFETGNADHTFQTIMNAAVGTEEPGGCRYNTDGHQFIIRSGEWTKYCVQTPHSGSFESILSLDIGASAYNDIKFHRMNQFLTPQYSCTGSGTIGVVNYFYNMNQTLTLQ